MYANKVAAPVSMGILMLLAGGCATSKHAQSINQTESSLLMPPIPMPEVSNSISTSEISNEIETTKPHPLAIAGKSKPRRDVRYRGVFDPAVFRLTGVDGRSDRMILEYEADAAGYFIVYGGDTLNTLTNVVEVSIGRDDYVLAFDRGINRPANRIGFYRVMRIPLSNPADIDGDGVDDVYEILKGLSPTNQGDIPPLGFLSEYRDALALRPASGWPISITTNTYAGVGITYTLATNIVPQPPDIGNVMLQIQPDSGSIPTTPIANYPLTTTGIKADPDDGGEADPDDGGEIASVTNRYTNSTPTTSAGLGDITFSPQPLLEQGASAPVSNNYTSGISSVVAGSTRIDSSLLSPPTLPGLDFKTPTNTTTPELNMTNTIIQPVTGYVVPVLPPLDVAVGPSDFPCTMPTNCPPGDGDQDGIPDAWEGKLAAKFAPQVRLPPSSEDWTRPASVDWYLVVSTMRFNHSGCSDCQVMFNGTITQDALSKQFHKGKDFLCSHSAGNNSSAVSDKFFLQPINDSYHAGAPANLWKVYAHIFRRNNGYAIQYWFFYAYNDSIGSANHEADWEHITVSTDANGNFVSAWYAQHEGGTTYNSGQITFINGTHPVVYSADGSHASYPKAGNYDIPWVPGLDDHCYENGPVWNTWENFVNVGEKEYPLNGQSFIKYAGRWGEIGETSITTGPLGPSFQAAWNNL
jgi:Vacuolar protein sorting-associated protein 62